MLPAPNNVTLVNVNGNKLLQWSHVLQPSGLPPDFELIHNFNITYLVHIKYSRDGGTETVTTVDVSGDENYLNLDVLDICKRLEFAVQAVINTGLYSPNSTQSVISNLNGEYIYISPSLYQHTCITAWSVTELYIYHV